MFLDATYCKARVGGDRRRGPGRSQAVVIATGVAADGHREVLGFAVGDSEDGAFWTAFLRCLQARGLDGVQLVISDAHSGLQHAIDAVLLGAAWQRCRVHFMRNVLAKVPKGSAEMVAAAIRTIFAQPDAALVREQVDDIAAMLGRQFPAVATHAARRRRRPAPRSPTSPPAHWRKIWSTNPLERLNREIKRRTDVVGIFPNPPRCCGWPARCSSRPTTNGRSPTAATSPKARWPCSPADRTRPDPSHPHRSDQTEAAHPARTRVIVQQATRHRETHTWDYITRRDVTATS